MGYRLHYASTYQVKYEGGYFNHKTEINRLLVEKCDATYNEITPESSDDLEVNREELVKLVQDMKYNPQWYEAYIASNGWDYSMEDFVSIFEEMISKSDQRNDFVVISWF